MVDPISNQMFSHDFQKFVLQNPSDIPLPPVGFPKNPFSLQPARKNKKETKKESRKERSPWEPPPQKGD